MNAPIIVLNAGGPTPDINGQLANLLGQIGQVAGITPKPVGQCIAELCEAKIKTGLSVGYVRSLRQYLEMFTAAREAKPVHEFTVADVEAWFDSRNESGHGRKSNIGRLSCIWSYGIRKGYCRDNPTKRLEPVRTIRKTPKILTARQSMRVMLHALRHSPTFLAWLVLSLKAGLRPYEVATFPGEGPDIRRVGWEDIDLAGKFVRVDASATKTRMRRVVNLTDDAVEWLALAKAAGARLPLSMQSKKKLLDRLRTALRWPRWEADVLRHTAASVLLAETQDAAFTSRQLGNSPAILMTNYAALLTRPEAARYRFKPKAKHWKLAEAIGMAKRLKLNTR